MDKSWSLVAESAALRGAGSPSTVWSGSPVAYALGADALVVVIAAGDRPDGSAVYAADEVRLRAPFPDEVVTALTAHPARLPILGFARVADGCMPLGELRVASYAFSPAEASPRQIDDCALWIGERLPFPVLDRVRRCPRWTCPTWTGWTCFRATRSVRCAGS